MNDQIKVKQPDQPRLNDTLAVKFRAMSDNAYCAYAEQMRKPLCLGWEAKVESGKFTQDNLDAFMRAAEWLGRHKALHEASIALASGKSDLADWTDDVVFTAPR